MLAILLAEVPSFLSKAFKADLAAEIPLIMTILLSPSRQSPKEKTHPPSRTNGFQYRILYQLGNPAIPQKRHRRLCVPPFREVCLFRNYSNSLYRHGREEPLILIQTPCRSASAGESNSPFHGLCGLQAFQDIVPGKDVLHTLLQRSFGVHADVHLITHLIQGLKPRLDLFEMAKTRIRD